MSGQIYIYHHLGLGDHFHCNGVVRFLLKNKYKNKEVSLFAKKKYFEMVKFMYRDLDNLKIIAITNNEKDELKERYEWNDFCIDEAVEVVFQHMTGVLGECLILREKILQLAEKHDIFNKQAVSRTVSQNYSDICGLRRTYHLMMSAIYGARPDKPYFFDICK